MEKKYFKEFKYMPYTGIINTLVNLLDIILAVKYPTLLSTKED